LGMALGRVKGQARFDDPGVLLGDRLKGIYRFLAEHGERIFGVDYFADLYKDSRLGRPTVPARVLATVMVLQAHEGLSDQEACDRLGRDLAWQAAAGVETGAVAFHPTTLVGVRNRLRGSGRPRRLFEDTKVVAVETGVLGNRVRVLDSTPVYDAVATQDTVTQLRAAIRKLLRALDRDCPLLAAKVRVVLCRMMIMRRRGNRRVIGMIPPPGRRWSTRWSVIAPPRWRRSTARCWRGQPKQPRSCWPSWPARTSTATTTGCLGSPGGWRPTG